MRVWSCFALIGALAACTSATINVGTQDAGREAAAAVGDAGSDSGPTIVASLIQLTPTRLLSDGTSLFWISALAGVPSPISSMPVDGGAIRTVVREPITESNVLGGIDFLAVDDVNVYYPTSQGIYRARKSGGGSPAQVTEGLAQAAAAFGSNLYWYEGPTCGAPVTATVKSAVLQGGSVSTVAEFTTDGSGGYPAIAVTATTAFLASSSCDTTGASLYSFPLGAGAADGGTLARVPGVMDSCGALVSDTDAVYCLTSSSILRVASDGSATALGTYLSYALTAPVTPSALFALDDTYAYWLDALPVGTVMRVPKTGGTPSVIARDTSPVAIAVDANAVYWSDEGGNIMRLAK